MRRFYLRRISTEFKVYIVLALLLFSVVGYAILRSGWLQPRTFDDTLFDQEECLDQKRLFNHSEQPRKEIDDIDDVRMLMVVPFINNNRGNGLFGIIDHDGSVVVEPTFEYFTEVYNGIIRSVDENNVATFYDLELNVLPTRTASREFYDAKRQYRIFKEVNTNPAYTLINRSSLSPSMLQKIEETAQLEMFYLSYYKEPINFYSIRLLSSVHERVFVVFDENLDFIREEYYTQPVYFEENGIAKVQRSCSVAYMNIDGEYIWYVDGDY